MGDLPRVARLTRQLWFPRPVCGGPRQGWAHGSGALFSEMGHALGFGGGWLPAGVIPPLPGASSVRTVGSLNPLTPLCLSECRHFLLTAGRSAGTDG